MSLRQTNKQQLLLLDYQASWVFVYSLTEVVPELKLSSFFAVSGRKKLGLCPAFVGMTQNCNEHYSFLPIF